MGSLDSQIPEEILRSEQKAQQRQAQELSNGTGWKPEPERVLGLPALPGNIIDLLVEYGPWLLLASGAFGLISSIGFLMQLSGPDGAALGAGLVWGSFVGMLASIGMILACVWLRAGRRMGCHPPVIMDTLSLLR